MTSPVAAFQECTGSYQENFSATKMVPSNLGLTDDLTVLAQIEIVTIFISTMKPSDPPLLADVTLRCGMYPAGKDEISQYLTIPGSPRHSVLEQI